MLEDEGDDADHGACKEQEGQSSWRHRRACPSDGDQDGAMLDYWDGRDKPGDDQAGIATTFAPVTYKD